MKCVICNRSTGALKRTADPSLIDKLLDTGARGGKRARAKPKEGRDMLGQLGFA